MFIDASATDGYYQQKEYNKRFGQGCQGIFAAPADTFPFYSHPDNLA
jgi:hypothetical protein